MLKEKYQKVLDLGDALGVKEGYVEEAEGKLKLGGVADYQYDADRLWDAIKTVPGWEAEVEAEIRVANREIYGVYTVEKGDTLSRISKFHFGNPNRYMEIFELNRDVLKNPDLIKIGQKLKIPKKD